MHSVFCYLSYRWQMSTRSVGIGASKSRKIASCTHRGIWNAAIASPALGRSRSDRAARTQTVAMDGTALRRQDEPIK
jgi:hypothetical protein